MEPCGSGSEGLPHLCSTTPQMPMDSALASSNQRSWRAPWRPRMNSTAVSAHYTQPPTCPLHLSLGLCPYPRGLETPDTHIKNSLVCPCHLKCLRLAVHFTDTLLPSWSLSPGGWALNMKELKLLQTIGKGEFGGELKEPGSRG